MNCQMCDVNVTFRDGRTHKLESVFIRGSQIRFMILPDMLKNAPMFKNIGRAQKGAVGMGMGDNRDGRSGRGNFQMVVYSVVFFCRSLDLFLKCGMERGMILL